MSSSRSVIIAGATGLVGDELLHQLLGDPDVSHIHVVTRRPIQIVSEKIIVHQSSDLSVTHWQPQWPVPLQGYIALGTTRKDAGSRKALEAVDYHLVVKVARMMAVVGVKHLAVVSSMLSHPWSPSHYLRCKGKMEQALGEMGFERLLVARPGPLLGDRSQQEAMNSGCNVSCPCFPLSLADHWQILNRWKRYASPGRWLQHCPNPSGLGG